LQLFCFTAAAESVFVEIDDFRPSFYLEIHDGDANEWLSRQRGKDWIKNTHEVSIVQRKKFIGFTDGKLFDFVYVTFKGQIPMFVARKKLRAQENVTIFESQYDPMMKWFHQFGVHPCGFFNLTTANERFGDRMKSLYSREFTASVNDIQPCSGDFSIPRLLIAAYDIESTGLDPKKDRVFQVSICFSRLGDAAEDAHGVEACKDSVVICVGQTDSVDGTNVLCVRDEVALLVEFRRLIVERNPAYLVGYNNESFDAQFLCKRASMFDVKTYFKMSPLKGHVCELVEKTLSSSALGNNELKQFIVPGRIEFDLFLQLKRSQFKLSSYKLNAVSQHFFGGQKDDVTYADILEASSTRNPQKLGVVAKYCIQDSYLCIRLLSRLKEIFDTGAMAKLCMVPHRWILSRGQQIKCMSLILNHIHGEYVVNYNSPEEDPEDTGYAGAVVIDAQKGFYGDVCKAVVTLDFASLYPSILRWRNLCYTTHVMDASYLGIEGVEYKEYQIADGVFETFAIRPGDKSVLCSIEETLGDARKATKKLMKSEKDPFMYSLLDAAQKAQKVTCNSLYGFTGTVKGMLPKKEIAAAVTCTGREIILTTKNYLEETHRCFCVYGDTDSVMVNFPIPGSVDKTSDTTVLEYLFTMGERAAAEITALFGYPVELEFENIYYPFYLVSKKRYAGRSLTSVQDPGKVSVKGLVSERRDNAPIVGKTARRCIEMLMAGEPPNAVTAFVVDTLKRIGTGSVNYADLTIAKELKKWEYVGLQPHAELAKKVIRRSEEQRFFHEVLLPYAEGTLDIDWDAVRLLVAEALTILPADRTLKELLQALRGTEYGSSKRAKSLLKSIEASAIMRSLFENNVAESDEAQRRHDDFRIIDGIEWAKPKLGDRIGYVVTEGVGDISSRVEDPRAVALLGLKPDLVYYLTQLESPLVDLLQHVDSRIKEKFVPFKRSAVNKQNGNQSITSFFR
ncbi:unnamed protein product, partial [Phaeothamnion confervicola]